MSKQQSKKQATPQQKSTSSPAPTQEPAGGAPVQPAKSQQQAKKVPSQAQPSASPKPAEEPSPQPTQEPAAGAPKTQQSKKAAPQKQPAGKSPALPKEPEATGEPSAEPETEKKSAASTKPPAGKGPAKAPSAKTQTTGSPAPVEEPAGQQAKAAPSKKVVAKTTSSPAPTPEPAKEEKPKPTEPAKKAESTVKTAQPKATTGTKTAEPAAKKVATTTATKQPPAKGAPGKQAEQGKKQAAQEPAKKGQAPAKKQKTEEKKGGGDGGDGGDDKKPPVPESLKKKQAARQKATEDWKNYLSKLRKDRRKLRLQAYNRARKYEKEYKDTEIDLIRKRRVARTGGNFFVEPEPKIAIVVRIRGIMGVSPKVKKILRLLRLRQLHNATFVKLSPPMSKMLKLVEPYVAYGYPNLKTVRSLIYKRGFGSVKGQRTRIVDNQLISKFLKRYNVLCIEDIVHELYTCGPNFKYVNKFLWPFKLNPPRGGFIKKRVHFTEGGDAGNREHYINKLVRRML